MKSAADALRSSLAGVGYAVVRVGSPEGFGALCGELGKVTQTIQVRIKPGGRFYPERPDAVPFHTDHPAVPTVAWYCERQDAEHGATRLLDGREAIRRLSDDIIAKLRESDIPVMKDSGHAPCLRMDPFRIYWLPVYVRKALVTVAEDQAVALDRLATALSAMHAERKSVDVRLSHGEALFLNNHAMLHGRDAIPSDSVRCLVRNYIV